MIVASAAGTPCRASRRCGGEDFWPLVQQDQLAMGSYVNSDSTPNKHKHLEFIQAAVNRMAGNLFLLKGWTVTLIAALFALAAKDANQLYVLVAYFPLFIFWILDGYFLSQERKFRALYDHVRKLDESIIDFSMDTTSFGREDRNTWWGAMYSRTLVVYYGGLGLVMVLLMYIVR